MRILALLLLLTALLQPLGAQNGAIGGDTTKVAELSPPTPRPTSTTPRPELGQRVSGKSVVAGAGVRRGSWHTISTADGLPDPTVVAIHQDRSGAIWFGTLAGVVRWDGFRMLEVGPRSRITSLAEDDDGGMWIGSREGLSFYGDGWLRTYTTVDGLAGDWVLSLFTDDDGLLWVGTTEGLSRYADGEFLNYDAGDGLGDNHVSAISQDSSGRLWFGTIAGISVFDGVHFRNYDVDDGIVGPVTGFSESADGQMWVSTDGYGIRRFDGQQFTAALPSVESAEAIITDSSGDIWVPSQDRGLWRYSTGTWSLITTEDGLPSNWTSSVVEDRSGNIWCGTGVVFRGGGLVSGGGVARLVAEWTTYTVDDGLTSNGAMSLAEDSRGRIWIGTHQGVNWVEGDSLHTLDAVQGNVWSIAEDADGILWFGSTNNGVFRYDAGAVTQLTTQDGLRSNRVYNLYPAGDGNLWVGTNLGLDKYDGRSFTHVGPEVYVRGLSAGKDGILWVATWTDGNSDVSWYDGDSFHSIGRQGFVNNIWQDQTGGLWAGSWGDFGVARFDGATWVEMGKVLGTRDVVDGFEDTEGHLWFASYGNGIIRYDGTVAQRILKRDGLAHDGVQEIIQDRHGDVWMATEGGVSRFHSPPARFTTHITNVVSDKEHGATNAVRLSTAHDFLSVEFQATDYRTRPNQMVYRHRLVGHDASWRQDREQRIVYHDLPVGEYTLEVQAVNRDLVYSQPATLSISVRPAYARMASQASLILALLGAAAASTYGLRRRRDQRLAERALMSELEAELQEARQMQMALMPTSPPSIRGMEVSGSCITANHVGGDLFQYFTTDDKISIASADVTGKAMEAAIPVVMFSGILDNQMEQPKPLPDLFQRLNRSLCRSLTGQKFICFTMVEINGKSLKAASCGNPYPLHFHNGEVTELKVDGYPLGVRPDTEYDTIEAQLHEGDYLVLYSDGIPETINPSEEMFGYERTMETVRQACAEGISAQDLVERLMSKARQFAGDVPQADDMTCVVVRVEA